ncbi:hypothetical protein [Azotobacter chroococcum]|uniref:Uncharacterized protein n=1 Tax=Azotobacter chroococcum NCIMB 8003 TaxID=1328314 RepID=A0A0C4WUG8_9GAMM|nr:hypothetical protein [Azotobacter chroococcum]AJE23545.1 Hypothetical protein Achr_d90 [Azotobacter chroococcum NCIMB 8003]
MSFDESINSIAVVIKEFRLRNDAERKWLDENNEIGIVSIAVDESGLQKGAAIDLNAKTFPMVREGDLVTFDGQGHLLYGPKNPGAFLVYSMLFFECADDTRELGGFIEGVVGSEATNIGVKAMLAANPTLGAVLNAVTSLTSTISSRMTKAKSRELYRRNGTLLRDIRPPFDILRSYYSNNHWIGVTTSIIPLANSNMLGSQPKEMKL